MCAGIFEAERQVIKETEREQRKKISPWCTKECVKAIKIINKLFTKL